MTREEAIFCEKSYIGETNCTDCKYYIADTCLSRESHKMAVKALEQEADVVERAKIDKTIEEIHSYKHGNGNMFDCGMRKAIEILKRNIGESK